MVDNRKTLPLVYNNDTKLYTIPVAVNQRERLPNNYTIAFLDTGVCIHHPIIARDLVLNVDYTFEGIEDEHSHGSLVVLSWLSNLGRFKIINLKVLDKSCSGYEVDIINALKLYNERNDINHVHLSFVQNKECSLDCLLLKEFYYLVKKRIAISAPAGNNVEKSLCPAKCPIVISMGIVDENGNVMKHSPKDCET